MGRGMRGVVQGVGECVGVWGGKGRCREMRGRRCGKCGRK